MKDMRVVIVPKSGQLNADDFLAGPMTITITRVDIEPGIEQPVSIYFDGDNNKPYKPCKSMARVMVHCWGPDASIYVGRSMTLFCDPEVKWGGMAVGGIRISHMSHIANTKTMALTATKGQKKPFIVKPLASTLPNGKKSTVREMVRDLLSNAADLAAVDEVEKMEPVQRALKDAPEIVKAELRQMLNDARVKLDDFPGTVTPKEEMP
jgi:hypothetical protein